jgi:protein-L-isoaspartate(D-aspartate) O-methyltransferase
MDKLLEIMVKNQIESRGIIDSRVLEAMRKVPRQVFVPDQSLSSAYEDHPLPIACNQTISQPYIVAFMSELCMLKGHERVLEIGTGSGYQTAVLSLLCKEVYTIERIPFLGKTAQERLESYRNIIFKLDDGYEGWEDYAPFDVILLTASPPEIPQKLLDQLSDNGRLIAPEGDDIQKLVRMTPSGKSFTKEIITYVRFVPMVKGIGN